MVTKNGRTADLNFGCYIVQWNIHCKKPRDLMT